MLSRFSQKHADVLGIISAILCLIHCLFVPVLLVIGSVTEHMGGHWGSLDYLFIVLALLAVINATRYASRNIAFGMWLSMIVFVAGLLMHHVYAEALIVSTLASVALAVFHIINYKQSHTHSSVKV